MPDSDSSRESAFVALLTEHQAALRYYVASLLPGESRAVDVSQQANLTIWDKRDEFEIGTNFRAWAFAIARYEVLNFRKKEARDSRLVFSDELEEILARELAEQRDDLPERQTALRSCLTKLKSADRELIRQRYFEKTTLQEYADQIGRSAAGLKVTLHRLRGTLARCIEGQLAGKGGRA